MDIGLSYEAECLPLYMSCISSRVSSCGAERKMTGRVEIHNTNKRAIQAAADGCIPE